MPPPWNSNMSCPRLAGRVVRYAGDAPGIRLIYISRARQVTECCLFVTSLDCTQRKQDWSCGMRNRSVASHLVTEMAVVGGRTAMWHHMGSNPPRN